MLSALRYTGLKMSRNKLPDTRSGRIHHLVVYSEQGDIDLYVRVNFYEEVREIAEIFVGIGKQGTTLQGMLDGWAIQTSIALQYGVPVQVIIDKFRGQSFPPAGPVKGLGIAKCSSLLDLVAQVLEKELAASAPQVPRKFTS